MNNLNDKVLLYRKSNNSKERNELYKEIRAYYLPRALAVKSTFPKRYHNDVMSSYDWLLLRCIEKWDSKKGVLFTTYWYIYTGLKLKSEVQEKYISKDQRDMKLEHNQFTAENLSLKQQQHLIFQDSVDAAIRQSYQLKEEIILSALKDFLGVEKLSMNELMDRGACFQPPSGKTQTFTFDNKPFIEFDKQAFATINDDDNQVSLNQEFKYRRLF